MERKVEVHYTYEKHRIYQWALVDFSCYGTVIYQTTADIKSYIWVRFSTWKKIYHKRSSIIWKFDSKRL